ncbi:MAG: OsmC family protein [Chloroflexi bacterium]|nr:OsmC family protein [Chloroflexota bacterium]
MVSVSVEWGPNQQLVARARQHELVIDRSVEGGEAGLRSGELLLMALGACTAGTLLNHELIRALPIRWLRVELEAEHHKAPSRYDRIVVRLLVDGDLDEAQRTRVLRVASACTIHNTLSRGPDISVVLESATSAEA